MNKRKKERAINILCWWRLGLCSRLFPFLLRHDDDFHFANRSCVPHSHSPLAPSGLQKKPLVNFLLREEKVEEEMEEMEEMEEEKMKGKGKEKEGEGEGEEEEERDTLFWSRPVCGI